MSLQLAARHLASQGRGPDTELVHMGRGEVDALQGLARAAGGSLSINPETGLLEAGFLSKLLPVVAGAGLAMIPGMAPFAPFLVGGITGLAKGDLMKGVTAGLGAYGGANITGGLTSLGSSLTPEAGAAVGQAGVDTAAETAARQATAAGVNTTGVAVPDLAARSQGALTGAMNAAKVGAEAAPFETLGKGLEYAGRDPSAFVNAMGGTKQALMSGAAAGAPFIADAMKPKVPKFEEDTDPGQQYTYEANPTNPTPEPDPYGRGQTYFKPRYVNAAAGGAMRGLASAQSNLGSYSDGGRLLRGPGDGVSDSIPAVIGGKQPARLADGEFVIPARVVSELGNGSTEAGAKQLYAMMDRIQKARSKTTGKKQVAKKTNARTLMPA